MGERKGQLLIPVHTTEQNHFFIEQVFYNASLDIQEKQ